MPAEFGIIYQAIFNSSLMQLPIPVRWVWACLLILSGATPYIRHGRKEIAYITKLPPKLVSDAIEIFLAPDIDSTTKTNEGCRLEYIEPGNERAGYRIINKEIWRDRSIEDRKLARRAKDTLRKRIKRAEPKEGQVEASAMALNAKRAVDGAFGPKEG